MTRNVITIQKKKFINIGIIIPTTSRKRNYTSVENIDFFRILFNSFLKTSNKSGKYKYFFYLGYDDDDNYFINNKENIERYFQNNKEQNMYLNLVMIENMQGKVGKIWSKLAHIASKNCQYLYQLGDDIQIISSGWEDIFIKKLSETNNIGVTGPLDLINTKILTQSFVHITHLKIFGYYFPDEIENWYIDDWITNIYNPERITDIKVINSGGCPRYNINNNKENYQKVLEKSRPILEKYINTL